MKNLRGSLILLLAAFFWGTTFVAQTSASEKIGTFTFTVSRCVVGSLFLGIVILLKDNVLLKKTENATDKRKNSWPWIPGIMCGVVLFFAMNAQQFGIGLYPEEAAASGRAGFLTATYVVMVAVVVQIKGRKNGDKLDGLVILSILGTVVGMYFLCMSKGFSGFYIGDAVELLCACCFTAHIMVIDNYSDVDSVKLSCMQFITSGLLSGIMCIILERPQMADILSAAGPILYAGILSSGVAYTCQMIGQKYAEPAVASIVMSLESVFAVLAGCIILNEVMSKRESLGCILVFASVILAQLPQFKKTKEP